MNKIISFITLSFLISLIQLSTIEICLADNSSDEFVEYELVCQVFDSAYIEIINSTYNTTTIEYLSHIECFHLMTAQGVDAESLGVVIEADTNVLYCDANYLLNAPEAVQGSQPFIDDVGTAEAVYSQPASLSLSLPSIHTSTTGAGIKVAVIDVGINNTHPLLNNVIGSGFDFVDEDTIAFDESGGGSSGHGTFVAGILNLVAPNAEIMPYRVLDTSGRGDGYSIAEAIVRAVLDGCKVINLSMIMGGKHSAMDVAIEFAKDNDVVIVCSAGNDSTDIDRFPASDSYTLSVTAVDPANVKADFSNFGSKIDVCAPGTAIYSSYADTSYAWWNGTSFAAPFVAGQIALMFERNPSASWNLIVNAVQDNAIDIDSLNTLYSGQLGFGLIDIEASINSIQINCGDLNGDAIDGDMLDLIYLVDYLFRNGPPPIVMSMANVNGIGTSVDILDLLYIVSYLFQSGPPLNCPSIWTYNRSYLHDS